MRLQKFFSDCGILSRRAAEAEIAATDIGYPVIVKPVDSSGARGMNVCYNEEELKKSQFDKLIVEINRASFSLLRKLMFSLLSEFPKTWSDSLLQTLCFPRACLTS